VIDEPLIFLTGGRGSKRYSETRRAATKCVEGEWLTSV
jgi:hypothetical protein